MDKLCARRVSNKYQRHREAQRLKQYHSLSLTRANNGLKNLHVASAPAKISCEAVSDITLSWCRVALKKIHCGENHSWCTYATLSSAVIDECLLDIVKLTFLSNAFDCCD